jgi:Ferritin-like domain
VADKAKSGGSGGCAASTPQLNEAPRREFVVRLARIAGVGSAVLALLDGTGEAFVRGDEADLEILDAALAIEHHAIALYDAGLKRGLFPPGLRGYAVEFVGDHRGHRDTQIAIVEERGGRPAAARSHYDLGPLAPGDPFIREALRIEVAAQEAYTALISQIDTRDYLLSAAFILVDEVRHMTVWRRVLGLKIY